MGSTSRSRIKPAKRLTGPGGDKRIDAVVGARLIHPFAERWTMLLYADIGADGSGLTYRLSGGVNWAWVLHSRDLP